MSSFMKYLAVSGAFLLCGSTTAAAAGSQGILVSSLQGAAVSTERSLASLASSADYRSASATAFLLAAMRNRLGETQAACAALSQSLEYYRKALEKETGVSEPAISSINDDSDGMAEVRARYGCARI
jgi:uncharacterized protein (DUF1501 family)